jgi:hypothetical protein
MLTVRALVVSVGITAQVRPSLTGLMNILVHGGSAVCASLTGRGAQRQVVLVVREEVVGICVPLARDGTRRLPAIRGLIGPALASAFHGNPDLVRRHEEWGQPEMV